MTMTNKRVRALLPLAAALIATLCAPWGAAAQEPVTIYMLAETTESHHVAQQAVAERFHETHPHIRIEFIHSRGSIIDFMLTLLAGSVPIDIGYMDPWVVIEWGRQGLLEDLAPYIERDAEFFGDIPQSLFDLSTVEGKIYGIPLDTQAGTVIYNVEAFNEGGVPAPTPEWTYDDLREYSRRLTLVGEDGKAIRHGFRIPTSRNWVPAVWALGGDVLDSWTNPTRFTGNSEATIRALEYYNDLLNIGAVQDWDAHRALGTSEQFIDRRVAMLQTNTFALGPIYDLAEFEWDLVPLPRGPAGRTGFINAHQSFIFSSSRHKEEAWEVLRFFTSPESLTQRVRITGTMPVRLNVIRDEWLRLPGAPSRHTLLNDLPTARSPWPLHNDIWNAFDRPAQDVMWGRQGVASAVANMEQLTTAAIQAYRARHGLD